MLTQTLVPVIATWAMLTQTLVPVIATWAMLTQIMESVIIIMAMLTQPLAVRLMLGRTSASLLIMVMCHMLTQTRSLLLDLHKASSRRRENQVLLHDLLHDTAFAAVLCILLCSHSLHDVQEM